MSPSVTGHDGEGYPSASKTFAEPQVELEQQSALGPAFDVALLATMVACSRVATEERMAIRVSVVSRVWACVSSHL